MLRQLTEAFPVRSQFDGLYLFEAANVIAMFGPSPYADNACRLTVGTQRGLTRQEMPGFLWELAKDRGGFNGMFGPDAAWHRLCEPRRHRFTAPVGPSAWIAKSACEPKNITSPTAEHELPDRPR
jgi:hypothetical protein